MVGKNLGGGGGGGGASWPKFLHLQYLKNECMYVYSCMHMSIMLSFMRFQLSLLLECLLSEISFHCS